MASRDATPAKRAPSTEAIEDYAKAIYAISRERDGSSTARWPSAWR
jgi:hypothetical protein